MQMKTTNKAHAYSAFLLEQLLSVWEAVRLKFWQCALKYTLGSTSAPKHRKTSPRILRLWELLVPVDK